MGPPSIVFVAVFQIKTKRKKKVFFLIQFMKRECHETKSAVCVKKRKVDGVLMEQIAATEVEVSKLDNECFQEIIGIRKQFEDKKKIWLKRRCEMFQKIPQFWKHVFLSVDSGR